MVWTSPSKYVVPAAGVVDGVPVVRDMDVHMGASDEMCGGGGDEGRA